MHTLLFICALNTPQYTRHLARTNHKIVPYFAQSYFKKYPYLRYDERKELVQEGYLGFLKACERFDESRGFKISTYSRWWIRKYMNDYMKSYFKSKEYISLDSFTHIQLPYSEPNHMLNEYDLESWEHYLLYQKYFNKKTFVNIAQEMNISRTSLRTMYTKIFRKMYQQNIQ